MSKEYDNQIQKVIESRNNFKDIVYTPLNHSDELKSRGKNIKEGVKQDLKKVKKKKIK